MPISEDKTFVIHGNGLCTIICCAGSSHLYPPPVQHASVVRTAVAGNNLGAGLKVEKLLMSSIHVINPDMQALFVLNVRAPDICARATALQSCIACHLDAISDVVNDDPLKIVRDQNSKVAEILRKGTSPLAMGISTVPALLPWSKLMR